MAGRGGSFLLLQGELSSRGASGLGLQIAEALGTQGARVVISARKAKALQSAQTHLAGLDIDASWIAADNAVEDDLERLASEAMDRLGKVDILVNNAGASTGGPKRHAVQGQRPRLFVHTSSH
jgi:gluconate 5-dehydrogenase